ncbi:MAG: DUF3806 domain-containing protein [Pseudomonadota bacterium]
MKDNAKFFPLGDELQIWVRQRLELLAEYYSSLDVPMSNPVCAKSLDELWVAWKAAGITDSKAIDSFLNCFGIGFGQLLIDDLGFEWAYLEDEYGTDIAVRALPGTADTRIAPLHFVLRRWESNEGRYVEAALDQVDALVDEHAADHGVIR